MCIVLSNCIICTYRFSDAALHAGSVDDAAISAACKHTVVLLLKEAEGADLGIADAMLSQPYSVWSITMTDASEQPVFIMCLSQMARKIHSTCSPWGKARASALVTVCVAPVQSLLAEFCKRRQRSSSGKSMFGGEFLLVLQKLVNASMRWHFAGACIFCWTLKIYFSLHHHHQILL